MCIKAFLVIWRSWERCSRAWDLWLRSLGRLRFELPPGAARQAQLALVSPRQSDASSRSNVEVLRQMLGARRVHLIPWLANLNILTGRFRSPPRLSRTLNALLARS